MGRFFSDFDYIAEDNPNAVVHLGEALLKHTEVLAIFPHLGTTVRDRPMIRKALVNPVRIYYRINEEEKWIQILRFYHTARQEPKDL